MTGLCVNNNIFVQDGLKKRMESLKSQIEEASEALEEESQKNVELLNLIFPSDVARKLWLGEYVYSIQFKIFVLLL